MKLIKYLFNGKEINLTGDNVVISSDNFNVDKDGNMICNNGTLKNVDINGGDIKLYPNDTLKGLRIFKPSNPDDTQYMTYIVNGGIGCNDGNNQSAISAESITVGLSTMWSDHITTPSLTQTSLEEIKKNIKKFSNALNIIKNSDIYTYNLKIESDIDKKHIGFVIGEKYNTPDQVIAKAGDGIDTYSMTSVLWQAVKELIEKVEDLEEKLKEAK